MNLKHKHRAIVDIMSSLTILTDSYNEDLKDLQKDICESLQIPYSLYSLIAVKKTANAVYEQLELQGLSTMLPFKKGWKEWNIYRVEEIMEQIMAKNDGEIPPLPL